MPKTFTIFFGVAQIIVGLSGDRLGGSVVGAVLSIQGFTTGIILGVFLLGIFTQKVNHLSALTGLVGGLALMTYIKFGTDLAWPWFVLVGSSATFLIGLATSLILEKPLCALAGLIGGLVVIICIEFGTDLSWPWSALIGSSATFLIGFLASLILEKK
jgi:hypothetical protein